MCVVVRTGAVLKQRAPLPSLSTVKGVLFDIDGTLTDSDPLHFIACAVQPSRSAFRIFQGVYYEISC